MTPDVARPRSRGRVAILAAVLALAGTAAVVPTLNPAGPPPGHTGGFGEPTCVVCHIGNDINAFGGNVTIEGLPDAYQGKESYLLTVVLRAEETVSAGFQVAVRFATGPGAGMPAGALRPVDTRVAVAATDSGQLYAQHTAAGAADAHSGGSSWTLEWVAPADAGPVLFHLAANSGNGDNSPLSDLVYTFTATVEPSPTLRRRTPRR